MIKKQFAAVSLALVAACGTKALAPQAPTPVTQPPATVSATPADGSRVGGAPEPEVEPPIAFMLGLMPLRAPASMCSAGCTRPTMVAAS